MVARVTTLKAPAGRLGDLVEYYAGLAKPASQRDRGPADYYLDPAEPSGRWLGSGRRALGLEGTVAADEIRALLSGVHPENGAGLGRSFGETSARGFDVTFSAPKSVSVLWALHEDPSVRREVAEAHDAAVAATVTWIETHGAVTRRGRQGVHQVDTKGLTVAVFRQHTSRSSDPQLHSHAIVAAKVQDVSGRWLSLDARWLKQQQRSISWVYDAALRAELSNRLEVAWEPVADGAGQSDLEGVPAELCERFSQRARQVEAKAAELVVRWRAEHDGVDPDPKTIATLERRAVTASRPAKTHELVGPEALRRQWRRDAAEAGVELSRLPGRAPGIVPGSVPGSARSIDREALVLAAIHRASRESATWLATDLSRHLAALLPSTTAADGHELVALVDAMTADAVRRCLELHPQPERPQPARRDGRPVSEAVTDRRLTTREVWDQEADLVAWARHHHDPAERSSEPHEIEAAVAGSVRLVLVVGPAGAGKTTVLASAVRQLQREGREVLGVAPSGKAADVLASEAGCQAVTLAGLLAGHHPPIANRATVIVDEAGMADTEDLSRLVTRARALGWRLVLVGDPAQLPAVGRSGMFATLCEAAGAHHLAQVHRFTQPWEAEASLALRRGDPSAADAYAQHQRFRTSHPALLAADVAAQYAQLTSVGRTVAITTTTAAMARSINLEIQSRIPTAQQPAAPLGDGTTARVGDTITTRRNDPRLVTSGGTTVRNRQTWTVRQVQRGGGVIATHPERGSVTLPADYVRRAVELGWAVTGYGNQGTTVDHGIAVIEPSSSRAGIYVAMTRGRERNTAWIPDRTGTLEAREVFADAIATPSRALSAHAVYRQLRGQDGPPLAPAELVRPSAGRELSR